MRKSGEGCQTEHWATWGTADPSLQTGSPRKVKLDSWELHLRPQSWGGGQGGAGRGEGQSHVLLRLPEAGCVCRA